MADILWHICFMPRADTADRLHRLDLLASRLKAEEAMTAAGLAAEFGVSPRTLFRDLAILRDRGLPVEADRGRGGGVRLHRNWGIGRLTLSYREAVDLLVSLAIAEQMQAPWLLANLDPIRRKLRASFAPALRDRIDGLRSRILVGRGASAQVLGGFAPPPEASVEPLFRAFLEQRLMRFSYRDATGTDSERLVEPQLLLLNFPVWYVVAWDRPRDGVRTFRCDRIGGASVLDDTFPLRRVETFSAALDGSAAIVP
jgi:predicted DNA-binding transcriptional regulator YafY